MAVGFSRDMWYNYIADRSHPPVASAVVEKPEYDPDHVYAWKPANNYKGWKLIARGEAGVDDAEVIQRALDLYKYKDTHPEAEEGGYPKDRIVFQGEFIISKTIYIPSLVVLDFQQARLTLRSNANCDMFAAYDPFGGHNVYILGGIFDGNKDNNSTGSCFRLDACSRVTIINSYILNFADHGIFVSDGNYLWHSKLISLHIRNCNGCGVYIGNGDRVNTVALDIRGCKNGIRINGGEMTDLGSYIINSLEHGLYIATGWCTFIGTKIQESSASSPGTYSNIYTNVQDNIFVGVICYREYNPTKPKYDVEEIAYYEGNKYIACTFRGSRQGLSLIYPQWDTFSYRTIVETNPSKDEFIKRFLSNKGTATFSGDGSTTQFKIAHGLVSTPSKVLVTPMSADAAGDFYVTADDTYIYINYKTAPPSGTDNIKLSWYAEV